ncbi:MAG: hypothetical protein R3E79_17860 [Caldilineaceae bacterium]
MSSKIAIKLQNKVSELVEQFWYETTAPGRSLFQATRSSFVKAQLLVQVFYGFLVYTAFLELKAWDTFLYPRELDLLWSLGWTSQFAWPMALNIIFLLFLGGACLALLFPHALPTRLLAFAGCLAYYSLLFSMGDKSHRHYAVSLIAFVLIFLPSRMALKRDEDQYKNDYLKVFWGAQFMLLLIYTLTGFWKSIFGLQQMLQGQVGVFHVNALPSILANEHFRTGAPVTVISDFLINHPLVAFGLFMGVLYLEIFAIVIPFRPTLHRVWAVSFIAMHIGIALTQRLFFAKQALLVVLLLYMSPFLPEKINWWHILYDLPLVGPFLAYLRLKLTFLNGRAVDKPQIRVYYEQTCAFSSNVVTWLSQSSSDEVVCRTKHDKSYTALQVKYPYLESIRGPIVHTIINEQEECVRVRSEGIFWALSKCRGVRCYFLLPFIFMPSPLTDMLYGAMAKWSNGRLQAEKVAYE